MLPDQLDETGEEGKGAEWTLGSVAILIGQGESVSCSSSFLFLHKNNEI
jgi:hypothetical protein